MNETLDSLKYGIISNSCKIVFKPSLLIKLFNYIIVL